MKTYSFFALAAIPAIAISFSSCSRDSADVGDDLAAVLEEVEELFADCDKDNTDEAAEKLPELTEKLSKLVYEMKNLPEDKQFKSLSEKKQKEVLKKFAKALSGAAVEVGYVMKNDCYGSMKLQMSLMKAASDLSSIGESMGLDPSAVMRNL